MSNTAKYMENKVEARMSLCLTPILTDILLESLPLTIIQAFIFLCSCFSMCTEVTRHPSFPRIFHKTSLFTVSKAFLISTKTWNSGICCSMHFSWICRAEKIISIVPLTDLTLSFRITFGQIYSINLFSNSLANTLPTASRRVIRQ